MRDFLNMARGGYPIHAVQDAALIARIRNDQLVAYLEKVSEDGDWLARITVYLLQHIALDPLVATRLTILRTGRRSPPVPRKDYSAAFLRGYGQESHPADEPYFVTPHLHMVANPVGFFNLSATSPSLPQVAHAIEDNLNSKLFKAALAGRRMERLVSRRNLRISERGSVVYSEAYGQSYEEAKANNAGSKFLSREKLGEVQQVAHAAADAVTAPLYARLEARVRFIARSAYSSEKFNGSYTEILLAIMVNFILPDFEAQQKASTAQEQAVS